jgi:hypothetical protein
VAITTRGFASAQYPGSTASLSLTVPAATQPGDQMLLYSIGQGDPVAPTTWTPLRGVDSNNARSGMWAKIATAADAGSTLTVTQGAATLTLILVVLSPCVIKFQLHTRAWGAPGGSTSLALGNTTGLNAGDVMVAFGSTNENATSQAIDTGSLIVDQGGSSTWHAVANRIDVASPSTPDPSVTWTNLGGSVYASIDGIAVTTTRPGRILKGRMTAALDDAAVA